MDSHSKYFIASKKDKRIELLHCTIFTADGKLVVSAEKFKIDAFYAFTWKCMCTLFTFVSAIFENQIYNIMLQKIISPGFFYMNVG